MVEIWLTKQQAWWINQFIVDASGTHGGEIIHFLTTAAITFTFPTCRQIPSPPITWPRYWISNLVMWHFLAAITTPTLWMRWRRLKINVVNVRCRKILSSSQHLMESNWLMATEMAGINSEQNPGTSDNTSHFFLLFFLSKNERISALSSHQHDNTEHTWH